MVNDLSGMLLHLVCHSFIEDFASMFIKKIGLWFLFLDVSLSGFGMNVILAS
jgi:hypothetical protein